MVAWEKKVQITRPDSMYTGKLLIAKRKIEENTTVVMPIINSGVKSVQATPNADPL
jgi:hypothetical protein